MLLLVCVCHPWPVLQTYGAAELGRGSGVLDVAGGRGYLAYALQCERGVRTTVIGEEMTPHAPSCSHTRTHALCQLPTRARAAAALSRCDERRARASHVRGCCTARARVDPGVRKSGLTSRQRRALRKCGVGQYSSLACCFGPAFVAVPQQRALLEQASLVCGMHPDEATESIVDLALAFNKPFAVVPCCVFAHLAPQRRVRHRPGSSEAAAAAVAGGEADADGGVPVRDIAQFCEYLKAKDARIQEALLPFAGRNKVLYVHPNQSDAPVES